MSTYMRQICLHTCHTICHNEAHVVQCTLNITTIQSLTILNIFRLGAQSRKENILNGERLDSSNVQGILKMYAL